MFQKMQATWNLSFDALTATCRMLVAITVVTVCSFVAQSQHFWTVKCYPSCTKLELLQLVLKVCINILYKFFVDVVEVEFVARDAH
jgi:hypothetical protein